MPMPVPGEAVVKPAPQQQNSNKASTPVKQQQPNMSTTAVKQSPAKPEAANSNPGSAQNNSSGSNQQSNKSEHKPNQQQQQNSGGKNNSKAGAKTGPGQQGNPNKAKFNGNNNNANHSQSNGSKPFDRTKYQFQKNTGGEQPKGQPGQYHHHHNNNNNHNNNNSGQQGNSMNKFQNGGGAMNLDGQTPAAEKKFTGRCRLFCGNLPADLNEEEFKGLFKKFGEIGECFLNTQRSFGFIKLDTRLNAEQAKQELDGTQFKNRTIRVRFATHGAAVRVKNLSPYISNEYLEQAFSMFGPVERAVVIVDDKGRPTGEGIVEFERKPASVQCINKCQENCFILTSYPRPIVVEPLEQRDEEDGLPEKSIVKNAQFYMEREAAAHFAANNSNEHRLAVKWRELYELEKQIVEEGRRRVEQARDMLEFEIEQALIENKTLQLKEDLRLKQEELQRMESMRKEEFARRQELEMRRQDMQQHEQMHRGLFNQPPGQGGPQQQMGGPSNNSNRSRGGNNPNNHNQNNQNNNNFSANQFDQLNNLPPDQQQALIAAQLMMAAAAQQQGNMPMFEQQGNMQMFEQPQGNSYNNSAGNKGGNGGGNNRNNKDDQRNNRRSFDNRRSGGGNNNSRGGHSRDDSYPGYDTKRARF